MEDESSFFKQDLIRECAEDYDFIEESALTSEERAAGRYFLGVDSGKRVDCSVVALLREEGDDLFRLVFLKQFPLGTPYVDVVGFIQRLNQRFDIVRGFCDQSAIGESLVEEVRQFAPQIEGLVFTARTKQDLLTLLQTRMEQRRISLPLDRVCFRRLMSSSTGSAGHL